MIDSRRMAMKLHAKLTADVAKHQREVVLDQLVLDAFGKDTLPAETILHRNNILASGAETVIRLMEDRRKRIAEDLALIRELEALFAEAEAADMKGFAAAMAARMREGK